MSERVKLSEGLLCMLIMVQDYRRLMIDEHMFKESHGIADNYDWYRDTQKYFNNIADEILERYSLCKNIHSFELVLGFMVTDEMRSTQSDELSKFELWYK